jgi:DNA processing protein
MSGDSTAERVARAALSAVVHPGSVAVGRRIRAEGAVGTWAAIRRGDRTLDPEGVAERLAVAVDGEAVLARGAERGVRLLCPGDAEWPVQVDTMTATMEPGFEPVPPPIALWVRGRAGLPEVLERSVAVVGSRAASAYGERVAGDLGADLALRGWTVISGAAYGVDAAAHRGALAMGGPTIAVLACGPDLSYPRPHSGLLERIADHGLVLSEVPAGATPTRTRFLSRNRVIAALAAGIVVVEAAARSGALSTAGWAHKLGREVMTVPGPVTSAMSVGCHHLVRSGAAILVTDAAEVVDAVGRLGDDASTPPRGDDRPFDFLAAVDRHVVETMIAGTPTSAAALAVQAGLTEPVVQAALVRLAEAEFVTEDLDGWRLGRGGP